MSMAQPPFSSSWIDSVTRVAERLVTPDPRYKNPNSHLYTRYSLEGIPQEFRTTLPNFPSDFQALSIPRRLHSIYTFRLRYSCEQDLKVDVRRS